MRVGISKKLVYLGLALCIAASMLAFACAKETAPKATPTAKPTMATTPAKLQPKYGGTFRLISSGSGPENLGSPASVSPRLNPFAPYPCVEHLVHWDEKGLLVPFLASGWKWGPDFKSLTMTLQKGIKFHDGTDLNAAAAKYCLDLIVFSTKAELKSVASIDVIDDYNIRLNLKQFDNTILVDMGTVSGLMISPTAHKAQGEKAMVLNPVGTGAFKFVSYTRDVSLKYEKFNDYWQKGKPYFDRVETSYIVDPVTAKASFLAGEGDAVTCSPVDAADLQKKGNFKIAAAPTTLFALAGDGSHPDSQFANLKVRQAVSYAIDTKAIVDAIGYGFFKTANQAAYPGLWSYNPNVVGYSYNPQKAKELLTAAGYPNGFKTSLTYATGNAAQDAACTAIQRYLSDVGINVQLDPVTAPKFTQVMQQGWKNSLVVCSPQFPIGYSPLNTISKNISARANNFTSVLHPTDIEDKLNQAFAEPDQDKMAKMVQEIQKMIFDDYCLINPIYISTSIVAEYPYVQDVQIYEPFGSDWRPYNGWLNK